MLVKPLRYLLIGRWLLIVRRHARHLTPTGALWRARNLRCRTLQNLLRECHLIRERPLPNRLPDHLSVKCWCRHSMPRSLSPEQNVPVPALYHT